MPKALKLMVLSAFSLSTVWAGTVSFSDQPGTYFSFRNISETGALVPPSKLETPTLVTSPQDTIKFIPSAYVVVENNGPVTETSVLSTQLAPKEKTDNSINFKAFRILANKHSNFRKSRYGVTNNVFL